MKWPVVLYMSFLILLLSNCSGNKRRLIFDGIVIDSLTQKPISNAKITLLCWRKVDVDDETYDKVDTVTDSNGRFSLKFEKGFKMDIASVANGYFTGYSHLAKLNNGDNVIKLALVRSSESGAENKQRLSFYFRYYTDNKSKPVPYGIDLISGRSTANKDSLDIWPVESDKDFYPVSIATPIHGGVIPILEDLPESQNSIAPQEGYLKTYKLTGKEKGFFVRCRDGKTYCRLERSGNNFQVSSPSEQGVYEDYGIMFNAIIKTGGSPNLNRGPEIDLEQYILDKI